MLLVKFVGLLLLITGKYPFKCIASTAKSKINRENLCSNKSDGIYILRDVFTVLQCLNHFEDYISNPGQIYDPIYSQFRDPMVYNITNFCIGRVDDQYNNPWNCHNFISCSNNISYDMPCPTPDLVYNPYSNDCEASISCYMLKSPCAEKADGKYLIKDVFAYLQCSSQQGNYVNCPDNQIFDPNNSNCRDIKYFNLRNFCYGKDGFYRSPWNCHSYIQCFDSKSTNESCRITDLVYDPYSLNCCSCEKSSLFPCRSYELGMCSGYDDGKYLILDVFVYLQCSSQQGGYVNCPDRQIFDPIYSNCRDADNYNTQNFCIGKPNNAYRNPWDCNSFISCNFNDSVVVPCGSGFVYDPYDGLCKNSSFFPCRSLKMNPCIGIADGKYVIQDVFAFFQCISQRGGFVNCSENQIFDPKYNNCMDVKDYNIDNFCFGRSLRSKYDYRNPWNCHGSIRCDARHKPRLQYCSKPDHVYNPYLYIWTCQNSTVFPCKSINKSEFLMIP